MHVSLACAFGQVLPSLFSCLLSVGARAQSRARYSRRRRQARRRARSLARSEAQSSVRVCARVRSSCLAARDQGHRGEPGWRARARARPFAQAFVRVRACVRPSCSLSAGVGGLGLATPWAWGLFLPRAQRGMPGVVPLGRQLSSGAYAASASGVLVNASRAARLPLRRDLGTPCRCGWADYGHLDGASRVGGVNLEASSH